MCVEAAPWMQGNATRSVAPVCGTEVIAHSAGHGTSTAFSKNVFVDSDTGTPLLYQRQRRPAFGGRDQVERSELIVLPPAPPVRQLLLPGFELCPAHERTGRRPLGGGVTDKCRGDAE